jgi:hypothetical protein
MTLMVQAFSIFIMMQTYLNFFKFSFGIIDLTLYGIALSLSVLIAYYIGLLFRKGLKLGPLIAGISMGVVLVMLTLPLFEWIIGCELPLWLNMIFVTVGSLFGAYVGVRLAFVILIFTQAFVSAYLVVRGVSLNLGGFPNEVGVIKDMFGLDTQEQ